MIEHDPSRRSDTDWLKELPNKLTLARIASIPILLLLYPFDYKQLNVFCALIFFFAAVTDYLDGYIARKYESVTPLGKLLDPIADKMLVAASLVLLAYNHRVHAILAGVLICRDIGVNGLRLMALEEGRSIEVSDFGKWKTFVLSIAIFCLMVNDPLFGLPFREVGMLTLWVSLGLSLYSAWLYGKAFLADSKISLLR